MRILPIIATLLLLANVAVASPPRHEPARSDEACPIPETKGLRVIEKSITIDRSRDAVYAFWRDLQHIPEFMEHVDRVEVFDRTSSHWTVTGPLGVRVDWNVRVVSDAAPADFAWCTRESERIRHYGNVELKKESPEATHATLRLVLRPFDPHIKVAMAMTGWDPEAEVETSLQRLKELLERPTN